MSWNGTQLKHFKNLVDDLQTTFNDMLPIISAMQTAIEGMGGDLGDIETWQSTINSSLTNIQNKLNGIDEGAQVNRPISSQAQAQDGTDNSTVMTPLRVKEAINKTVVTGEYTGDGEREREINIGFEPKTVFLIRLNSVDEFIVIGEGTSAGLQIMSTLETKVRADSRLQTTANGFTVGGSQEGQYGNIEGNSYFWIAFP